MDYTHFMELKMQPRELYHIHYIFCVTCPNCPVTYQMTGIYLNGGKQVKLFTCSNSHHFLIQFVFLEQKTSKPTSPWTRRVVPKLSGPTTLLCCECEMIDDYIITNYFQVWRSEMLL